jgi:arsenate reductase (glutaredoxin)
MITLYGIKNCDTVKKARVWLEQHHVTYRFHDLRDDGLDAARLKGWIKTAGWETLLNTRSTTWRQLPDADKHDLDATRAAELMLAHPTLIKRPVLENGTEVTVGFSAVTYEKITSV